MCPVPPARRNRRCACAYRSRPPERESSFLLPFGLFRRSGRVRYLLHMHEDSALVHLRARITRLFPRQHFDSISLGVILRAVAEPHGIGIFVPAARVAGDPVDDLEANVRMIDA